MQRALQARRVEWWGKLLPVLRVLDQHNGELRHTNLYEDPKNVRWPSPENHNNTEGDRDRMEMEEEKVAQEVRERDEL